MSDLKNQDKIVNIHLTKSQCKNVCDFIECNFLENIRRDEEIDNISWVVDMMDAYTLLKEALYETN